MKTLIKISFVCLMLIISMLVGYNIGHNDGYKEGQVDMMLGNSSFILMEKANQSRYWKKVEPYKIYCDKAPGEQSWYYWPDEHYGLVGW